jgi:hypothetical protein
MRRKNTDHAAASRVDLSVGQNPLIRRSDRVQSRTKNIIITLMILMIPVSAWLGMNTLSTQQTNVAEQQYSRHQVTATTLAEAAPGSPLVQSDFAVESNATVDATWTYDGGDHTGQVSVITGAPAGTEVPIWVDNDGVRSTQPITGSDATAGALFTGFGSLLAISLLLYGVYCALRFRLDSQRDADWDRALRTFMDENSLS